MITAKLFNSLFPTKGLSLRKYNLVREREGLIAALNSILPRYEINTHKRICAFLANCGIETDFFKTTEEYASGWAYDISYNRAKAIGLGNTAKGDGPRYKGSGLSQTTGKTNFKAVQLAIGKKLGIDVVKNPEILRENIDVAVESACIFWKDNNLNYFADRSLFKNLSGIVNRGDKNKTPLHWAKRKALYDKLLAAVPEDFSFEPISSTEPEKPAMVVSEPEVLTPSESNASNETLNQTPAENLPSDQSKIKQTVDKYLNHAKTDSAKNIFQVIGARIMLAVTTVFGSGITGKIFLIIIALVIIGVFIYALVYYRQRFFAWIKAIIENLFSS